MSSCDWYLIYTKAKQESVALMNLERQAYPVYLPMHCTRRRVGIQLRQVTEPLFPRYLFIALNAETDNWGPIRSTRGVANLVRFGGVPAKVPSELVDLLKEQEQDRLSDTQPLPAFKSGQRVEIMDGVMSGYEGIFEAKTGSKRATVLLGIADQYTRVQVPLESLE